jgi:hypothetical protein
MRAKKFIGKSLFAGLTVLLLGTTAYAQNLGFSVSVDGEHVAGDAPAAPSQRKTDVGLAATDIQLRYDGLDTRPLLNVLPTQLRQSYRGSEMVELLVSSNYPAFVARTDVIISADGKPVAVLNASPNGKVGWIMPPDGEDEYTYVARVYDASGRFDETAPLNLYRTSRLDEVALSEDAIAPGWGEDRTAIRNIPLSGGAVTVYGRGVLAGSTVSALGETVPVDNSGAFVIQRVLPAGEHDVNIAVAKPDGETVKFRRSVAVPDSDWFYVALADVTIGARSPSSRLEPASGEFSETYVKGQAQFYLKGKIKGEYLLTASGDTGEGPISEMFSGILSKDPRAVLSRIDPNDFYPVYGDDSVMVEDAPTRGKLYVRLEKGDSKVMWGTFRTEISNSAFYTDDRVLYGAAATLKSDQITPSGERRYSLNVHAAHPGTMSQRDVLRGSGGSAYFLHRQDIMPDSETITVEVRDAITGLVRARRTLAKGVDYRVNYMQGVLILTNPLASSTNSAGVASTSEDTQFLVVQYEYSPIASSTSDYALAGAGEVWINDHIRVGATAVREDQKGERTSLIGANVRAQVDEDTYISAEVMQSEGVGTSSWVSTDGGLTFVEESIALRKDPSYAARVEGRADLALFGLDGEIGAMVEGRQAGFAASNSASNYDQLLASTFATLNVTPDLAVAARYDHAERRNYSRLSTANLEVAYLLQPDLTVTAAINHLDVFSPTQWGQRTNLGVGIAYALDEDLEVSAFARKTVYRTGNLQDADRVGVGGKYRISDAVTLEGEISAGTTGLAGMAGIVHQPTPDERNYIGYRVTSDDNVSLGTTANSGLVVGSQRKVNEVIALHSEAIYNTFTRNRTLTQSYGVTLTPDQFWTVNGAFERGNIYDPNAEDIQRTAVSLGAGYVSDNVTGSVRGEFRDERSDLGTRNGRSFLISSALSWRTSEDWRLLASADGLFSDYDNPTAVSGDYIEASVGYAYRPADNERLNALMRYTFLYDLPGVNQVTAYGATNGPAQRSHILSVDANYDINEWLTVGAKYGFRIGEVSQTRGANDFVPSSAHLGIIRADAKVLEDWSVLLEGRALVLPEAESLDFGALAAVYYSVNDNARIGLGYNFSGFSDDLRDLRKDHQGVFLNLIAKY